MDPARAAVSAVAICIVVLTLGTGPLGPISIDPPASGFEGIATGNATVTVLSGGDEVTFRASETGQEVYYLEVSPVRLDVSGLVGNPLLTYSLSIEEKGYAVDSLNPLGELGDGTHDVSIDRQAFERDGIERDEYDAELELRLRGDREMVLYSTSVTVEVDHGG